MLPFVVIGLATGSVYALAGMGLVLTYKTSGVFNFAHGSIATVAAYIFYQLYVTSGWNWFPAAVVSIGVVGIVGGLLLERLARRVADVEVALRVVAMVGVSVAIQALAVAWYGAQPRIVPPYLPTETFHTLGVHVGYDQLILFLFAAALAVTLSVFFKRSRLGVAMRAVVDDADLTGLTGTSPVRVRSWAWVIGSLLAAVSGVLLVPTIGLNSTILSLLMLQALGAAAIGAFRNIWLTYAGGLLVGIAQSILTKYIPNFPRLVGLPSSVPFIVLFVVILVIPKRHFVVASRQRLKRIQGLPPMSKRMRVTAYLATAVLFALVPEVAGTHIVAWNFGLVFALVFASLHLLVQEAGQVSLCQATFVAVGATTFSRLTAAGVPWLVALIVGALITVPVGAIVAIPSIRLAGVYLAIATFGFGLLVQQVFFPSDLMFGQTLSRNAPRPSFFGTDFQSDKSFYWVILAVVGVALGVALLVERGRLGRLLRGLASSPTALESYGTTVNLTRVLVFCMGAFLAGLAGGLYIATGQIASAVSLSSSQSLLWLAVLFFAASTPHVGSSFVASSLAGGIMLYVIPGYINNDHVLNYLPVLFGASAVFLAVTAKADAMRRQKKRPPVLRAYDRSVVGVDESMASRLPETADVKGREK